MSNEFSAAPSGTARKELGAGSHIGPYSLTGRVIGSGGYAHVYEATHPTLGLRVAIKVQDARGDATNQARSLREAMVLARIQHRNVVRIFDAGDLGDGRQYLAMELLAGDTLREVCASSTLSRPQQVTFLRDIASALDAVHGRGLVHRDLKPSNIFVCRDDDGEIYPKLIDFGIAKDLSLPSDRELTTSGSFIGTPAYMSPEQCLGKRTIDARSDIYAFGVVAYELLCGHPPFEGVVIDVAHAHAHSPVPSIRTGRPDLPVELDAVFAKILAKDPEERPGSARDAAELLERALSNAAAPASSSSPRTRRSSVLVIVSAAAAVALVSFGVWSGRNKEPNSIAPAATSGSEKPEANRAPAPPRPQPVATPPIDARSDAPIDAAIDAAPDAHAKPRTTTRRPKPPSIDDVESLPSP
jgi:serine/threonine-protein kinase